jgi:hypothetical protein
MAQNDILAKVSVIINAQTAQLGKDLKGAQSSVNSFSNGLKTAGKAIAGAFAIRELASFTLDIVKLAGETKGVKAAFDLLPGSIKVLEDLKAATGGTVSELELMKRTVQAANFGISLSALPKLLEFATLRAQQTGQSVDYLVDSIVTGIGRKSPLILDNLGISAVQLKNELGGVSIAAADIGTVADAVGRIAGENLKSMAGFSENASTKIQQLTASWEDLKAQLGTRANEGNLFLIDIPLDILQKFVDVIKLANSDPVMESFNNQTAIAVDNFKKLDKAAQTESINRLVQDLQSARNDLEAFNKEIESGVNVDNLSVEEVLYQLELMKKGVISLDDQYKKFLALYKSSNEETSVSSGLIADLEERLKQLNEDKKLAFSIGEIQTFNIEIQKLKEQLDLLNITKPLSRASTSTNPLQTEVTPFNDSENPFALNLDLDKLDEAIVKLDLLQTTYGKSGQAARDFATASNIAFAEQQEAAFRTAQAAAQMGDIIGNAFGNVISGQEDMKTAIIRATTEILKQFLARAIGGMISSAATSGAPPPIAIALAAAGAGAISAMFSKLTGKARGGSVGGASISSGATRSSSNFSSATSAQNSQIIPNFKIQGQDLWVIFNNYTSNNKYTSAIGG